MNYDCPPNNMASGPSIPKRLKQARQLTSQGAASATVPKALAGNLTPAARPRLWRTIIVAALLCLWEGFPFSVLNGNALVSYQIYGVITFLGVGMFLTTRLLFRGISMWELLPAALFTWCCIVSAIYSIYLVPQPLIQWMPAAYSVSPLLAIFFFKSIRVSISDALAALYWTGAIASIFIIAESFTHTGLLDYYSRGSAFSEGRIVFFKLPSAFGLMIALVLLTQARRPAKLLQHLLIVALTGYNLFVLTESRLMIVGIVLASALTWMFVLRGTSKIITGIVAPLIAVPLVSFLITRYMYNVSSLSEYLKQDTSANWRKITDAHFASFFYGETQGFGFGFMSANENYNNILAFSTNRASKIYGVHNYSIGLDDIGLAGAMYQYGYVGFAFVVVLSILCIFTLARSVRFGRAYAPVASIGIFMGTMMLNPIPMNYFTLFYTAHIGALLWFIASETRYGGVKPMPKPVVTS